MTEITKARVVLCEDGHLVPHDIKLEYLIAFMQARGYMFTKMNDNQNQRAELQGQPKFSGIAGPMWGGDHIRYECPQTYKEMSQ